MLCARFTEVLVPLTVWTERPALPGTTEPAAVRRLPCVRIVPDVESLPPAVDDLDPGEQQALAIALGLPGAFVLVDDGDARRVARAERLPLIGTIGLIAVAKAAGLCPSAREKYELLLTTRFRIDVQIVNDVLRDLGEPELPG